MKHIFIVNPNAAFIDKSEDIINNINKICTKLKLDFFVFVTEYKNHAKELSGKMCDFFSNDIVRFYCCGGMGTLNEVVNGVASFSNTEFAFYPIGALNDLISAFHTSKKSFSDMEALIYGEPTQIDVIKCSNLYALNAIGCGIDTSFGSETVDNFIRKTGQIHSRLPEFLVAMKNIFRPAYRGYSVTIDGVDYSGKLSAIMVMNNNAYAGKYYPCKDAVVDDGVIDLLLYKVKSFEPPEVKILKCKRMRMSRPTGEKIPVNIDGDTIYLGYIDIEVIHKAINFVVPHAGGAK